MSPAAAVAAAAAAVALLAPAPGAAAAGPVSTARVSAGGAASDFWTPARMRAAQPLDMAAESAESAGAAPLTDAIATARGPRLDVAPSGTAAGVSAGARAGRGHAFKSGTVADPAAKGVRTHGRVFFKVPGVGLASCSGTAISSNRRNLVLTAGHCVNGGGHEGRWYTHWVFVPAYSHGTAPFGAWRAKRLYSTPIWVEYRDPTGDIGFATVAARKGTRLQDAVGASGISFGRGVRRRYQAFGYPANPKDGFDGESERYCNSHLRQRDKPARRVLGPKTVGISCDMTEGASGGSWIAKQGYAVSLSSYYYPQLHHALFGPYFGSLAHELYEGTQIRCDGRPATIVGTGKADRLRGTPGRDVIVGGAGADRIVALGKGDIVCGGAGADHLAGGAGRDLLIGGAGNDHLAGGSGRDKCVGGSGRNRGVGCEGRRGLKR